MVGGSPLRIGITLGDPRGIGPEVTAAALGEVSFRDVEFVVLGPGPTLPITPPSEGAITLEAVGSWEGSGDAASAGAAAVAAVQRGIDLALSREIHGLVTGPISKAAVAAAGFPWPGHTELLRERAGADDVAMIMAAERTPLGGPLRLALLTVHVALRDAPGLLSVDLVERRARLAAGALRDWWGLPRPRLAFAGVNPHASEGGLFGDEETRILEPAIERLGGDSRLQVTGLFPADSVFRKCIGGDADVVVTPVHDVGLAVLKTVAPESGINVTAGLPFPRTSPDHGTAFDIAGSGRADPRSMIEAVRACVRFARNVERTATEGSAGD